MAISFVGSMAPVGANNGGNVTLTFTGASGLLDSSGAQASLQQGDVVVVAYASSGIADQAMSTSSSGWTEVHEAYANGSSNDTNLALYYKVMGASPDTSFVAVGPTGNSNATVATAFAFRGVDAAVLDIAFVAGNHAATGTATTNPNPPSITPSGAGAWIVVAGAGAAAAGANYNTPGDLSGTTNHFRTRNHAETIDCTIGMGIKTNWSSGAFDGAAWTGGVSNAGDSWAAIVVALKSAPVTHTTTGALTGQIGSVSGSAAHIAIHTSTGALTGPGSAVAGAAARTRAHPASGDLIGPGAAVAGTSVHNALHPTSGALTGQLGSLSASAARFRTFATGGVLAGQEGALSGSAARVGATVSHAAFGALIAETAEISGAAVREVGRRVMLRARRRRRKLLDYGMIIRR